MAGRRGCVNSLWSGSERVRIGERLKATLAGILELDLLRCRHLEMVDAALDKKQAIDETEQNEGTTESATEDDAATSRRQQVSKDGRLWMGHGLNFKHLINSGSYMSVKSQLKDIPCEESSYQ